MPRPDPDESTRANQRVSCGVETLPLHPRPLRAARGRPLNSEEVPLQVPSREPYLLLKHREHRRTTAAPVRIVGERDGKGCIHLFPAWNLHFLPPG